MKQLIEDIKTGSFRHVYLLYGKEHYLRNQYRDRLVKAILPEDSGMNLTVFGGDHLSEGAVIDQGETLPFFAERRVIRLDRTGLFKAQSDLLPDYVKSVPDYLYMVFTEDEVDKRSRLYKAVSKSGRCVEFGEQDEQTLSTWVVRMLSNEQLKIRRSSLSHLLERTGSDMNRIATETDKLIHFCTGKEEVTLEDIDLIVSDLPEDRVFDMISALTRHSQREAMDLYADLIALKEPPLKILSLIASQYNRLLMISELKARGLPDGEIAKKAGMPPFAVKKSAGLARSYTAEQLKAVLELCASSDEDIKSGRISDRNAVELLLVHLGRK